MDILHDVGIVVPFYILLADSLPWAIPFNIHTPLWMK